MNTHVNVLDGVTRSVRTLELVPFGVSRRTSREESAAENLIEQELRQQLAGRALDLTVGRCTLTLNVVAPCPVSLTCDKHGTILPALAPRVERVTNGESFLWEATMRGRGEGYQPADMWELLITHLEYHSGMPDIREAITTEQVMAALGTNDTNPGTTITEIVYHLRERYAPYVHAPWHLGYTRPNPTTQRSNI